MSRDEIIAAINAFLDLIDTGKESVEANESALAFTLDHLAIAYHFLHSNATKAPDINLPHLDHLKMRKIVEARFPNYGYYNMPSEIGDNIAETGIMVGDAIADITDIALDLKRIKWRLNNTDIDDALWHFRPGYEAHWGEHLRYLQLYLHECNFNLK